MVAEWPFRRAINSSASVRHRQFPALDTLTGTLETAFFAEGQRGTQDRSSVSSKETRSKAPAQFW